MSGGKRNDAPLHERAAEAALAELRGDRTGILGATGETTLRSLIRTHRVPGRWSVAAKLLMPETAPDPEPAQPAAQ